MGDKEAPWRVYVISDRLIDLAELNVNDQGPELQCLLKVKQYLS